MKTLSLLLHRVYIPIQFLSCRMQNVFIFFLKVNSIASWVPQDILGEGGGGAQFWGFFTLLYTHPHISPPVIFFASDECDIHTDSILSNICNKIIYVLYQWFSINFYKVYLCVFYWLVSRVLVWIAKICLHYFSFVTLAFKGTGTRDFFG